MNLTAVKVVILEAFLLGVCLLGDHLLEHPVTKQHLLVAMFDSLTHGLVGGVSWSIVCDIKITKQDLCECAACMMLAMLVDVDHFLAAGSFNLKAALSLSSRPPFHATTIIPVIATVLLVLSTIFKPRQFQLLAMMFTVAWLSHHIRDATRRGLWFYPFGSTLPLPKTLYISFIMVFPLGMRVVYYFWKKDDLKANVQGDFVV